MVTDDDKGDETDEWEKTYPALCDGSYKGDSHHHLK
jgi:hypothetical protein